MQSGDCTARGPLPLWACLMLPAVVRSRPHQAAVLMDVFLLASGSHCAGRAAEGAGDSLGCCQEGSHRGCAPCGSHHQRCRGSAGQHGGPPQAAWHAGTLSTHPQLCILWLFELAPSCVFPHTCHTCQPTSSSLQRLQNRATQAYRPRAICEAERLVLLLLRWPPRLEACRTSSA